MAAFKAVALDLYLSLLKSQKALFKYVMDGVDNTPMIAVIAVRGQEEIAQILRAIDAVEDTWVKPEGDCPTCQFSGSASTSDPCRSCLGGRSNYLSK